VALGDLVRAGKLTKEQLIGAGFGHLTGYGDEWMNNRVDQFAPLNINLRPDGSGARNSGYYDNPADTSSGWHEIDRDPAKGIYLKDGIYYDGAGNVIGNITDNASGIDPVSKIPIDPTTGEPTAGGKPLGPSSEIPQVIPPIGGGGSGGGGATGGTGGGGVVPLPGGGEGGGVDWTGGLPPDWSNLPDFDTDQLKPDISETDPEHDLRSMEIKPGSLVDRFKLAQQQFGTFADATSSQYEAALRDATRHAAGAGRLGSGMLRTSYGDLANERANALTASRDTLFQEALKGSIQDAQNQFDNYLKEQNFQLGSQGQGFNQAITAAQLQEQLTNGAFQRALAQLIQGNSNDPSSMLLQLSQIFGGQAGQANNALGLMMQMLGAGGNNNQQSQQEFLEWLKTVMGGSRAIGGGAAPQGETIYDTPTVNG